MIVCLQCSIRALGKGLPVPKFNETPEQHLLRVHPTLAAATKEDARRWLEVRLVLKMEDDDGEARN